MLCLPMVPDGDTIPIHFYTSDKNGGLVAPSTALEAADVKIYKDGSATQRSSESGFTMTSPFDSVTGHHVITIDLSDNTDAGFYSVGSWFVAVAEPDETVDAETVGGVVAVWRIVPAEASAGVPDVNVASMDAGTVTATAVATDAIDADALATDAVNEIVDQVWDEAAADHTSAGSMGEQIGTDIDAILADTADIQPKIGTPAGADVSADIAAVKAETALIVADTNELQTDWANGGRLDLIIDELTTNLDAVETDTQDLQTQIGTAGAGLTAVPWNSNWDVEVQSEVDDALVVHGLDHLIGASVTGTDIADNSIIAQIAASGATADWDTFANTTDSLQALQESGVSLDTGDLSAALMNQIADHVLTRDGANLEAGSDGDRVSGNPPENSLYGMSGQLVRKTTTSADGSTLTVHLNDGTTVHYTRTLTRDRGAAPISGTE